MKLFSGLLFLSLATAVAASEPVVQNSSAQKANYRTPTGAPDTPADTRTLGAKIPNTKTVVETIVTRKKGAAPSTRIQHVHVKTVGASAAFLKQRAAQQAAQERPLQAAATSGTVHPNYGGPSTTIVNAQNFGSSSVAGQPVVRTLTYASPGANASLNFATTAGTHFTIQSSSCTATQCTASVSFAPKNPGLLQDSINATDGSGNLIDQTFVYGVGTAPQLEFQFGGRTEYDGYAGSPSGVAVGPDGAFYIVDQATQQDNQQVSSNIVRVHFGGNIDSLPLTNVCNPQGIAVDGAGTIYIADPLFNQVVALSSAGVQTVVQTTPLSAPGWVAVDGTGALYISDSGNGRIIKLDNHNVETTLISGLNAPSGLAVDSTGNVFFADAGSEGEIQEYVAATGQTQQISDETGTIQSLSVDASGTLYFTTPSDFGVFNSTTGQSENMDSEDAPFAVAVALNGAVVYSQMRNGNFDIFDPTGGNFGLATERNSTTTGTFTIANTGNSPLTVSALSVTGTEFAIDPSSQCTAQTPIAPGATCQVNVTFTPPAIATYSENITASSNTLNSSSSAPSDVFNVFGSGYGAYTSTTLSYSPNAPALGQTLTLTATVMSNDTSGFPAPTGTVTFFDGDGTLGSANLSGNTAVFTTSTLSQGTHEIFADYNGDSYNAGSGSYSAYITVGIGSNSTSGHLAVSAPTINLGDSETLTVSFTGTAGTPTGTVTFNDQNGQVGTATLSGSGNSASASITLNSLTGGSHGFYVTFPGDANYAPNNSDTQNVAVTPGSSSTQLSVSSNSPAVNQPLTLTATISAGTNPPVSGNVTFSDQNGILSYGAITPTDSGGTASIEVALGPGSHQITAAYSDDSSYTGSTSPAQTVNVALGTAQLGLAVSAANINSGQTEILFLTLGNRTDQTPATGTVTFSDQNGTLSTGTLCACADGNAYTLTTTTLSPGVHNITANYAGDTNYNPASSSPQTVTVSDASLSPTTTTLSASSSSITSGQTETLTATIQGGTSPAQTGMVTFSDQNGALGSVSVTATNTGSTGTLSLQTLSVGSHQITASYSGDSNYGGSVSTAQTVTVSGGSTTIPTTTSLGVSSTNPALGSPETFTATVSGNGNAPSGSVTFADQNGTITSANLVTGDGTSTASVTYTGLSFGSHQVTATYNGSSSYASSTSTAQTVNVGPAASTTTLTVNPSTATAGQAVTLTGSVQSYTSPALTGSISFADQNGTLGSANITANSTGGSATLTLTTLSVGAYQIIATYSSDSAHGASTSSVQTVTINQASGVATTTTLVAPTSVAYKSPITLRAFVTSANATVSGQIIFCDVSAPRCAPELNLATAQIVAPGSATVRLPAGTIGTHSYVARFLGTTAFSGSSSSVQSVSVTGTYSTTTTIAATGSAGNYTLTGTVVGLGSRSVSPTGTVTFNDTSNTSNPALGTTALGSGALGFAAVSASGSPAKTGSGSYGVATGDFNGDGFADIAVENYSAGTISVLLGNGDGTFKPQVSYAVGSDPERVLVADFNGDGIPDLVVANTGSNTVSILLGNGDGTFKAQVTYGTSSPVGLGVMDLNHDGIADIVAGDYYSNTFSVLLGNGDGTFKTAVTYATGGTPQTLAEGDFNGDGNVDIAVGNLAGNNVGIFLGNGDGTFQAQVTYAVGRAPQGVQVGDFNGDGYDDLAVSNSTDNTISILLGKGDGTFQPQVTYPVGADPVGLVVADFNGDGKQDLSVGNTAQSALTQSILLGNGDGTFQPQLTFPTGNFPYGEAAADFNGDGFPDFAISNFSDGTATILLSQVTETAVATISGASVGAPTGSHNINASYSGDINYAGSTSATIPLLNNALAASSTQLTISPTSATAGQTVTFSASVFGTMQTSPVPTGTVTLTNTAVSPATMIGTISLGSTGSGSFSTSSLAAGTYSVVASYGGDNSYAASSSAAQTLTVTASTGPIVNSRNFGSVTVAGTPATVTLAYSPVGATSATVATAQGTVFKTQPAVCGNSVCTVQVTFTPTFPGLAPDALTLKDANGNLLGKTFLYGIGTAPQLGYDLSYGVFNTYSGTIKSPASVAVGPDATLYVGDTSTNQVYKVTAGSYSGGTPLAIIGLGKPGGIAVSGDGTVYVADQSNNLIRSFSPASAAQGVVTTSALSVPNGVAVDGTGALYISDTGHGRIIKIDNQGAETTVATGLTSPGGLALDSAGDLFYADQGSGGEITEIPAGGGTASVGTNLGVVGDLAVAPSGRVYFATTKSVSSILNGTVSSNGYFNLSGNPVNYGLALDRFQDVITTNTTGGVLAVTYRPGSSFGFGTPVGTTNTCCDSIENTGNSPLTVTSLSNSGANYALHVGGGECVAGQVLQPTQTCGVAVDFSPTAFQNYSDTVTVTSNSLNAAGSTNTSSLTETGYQIPTTTTVSVSPNPARAGQAITFTATLAFNSTYATPPTGTVKFLNADGSTLASVQATGVTTQYTTSALTAGNYSVTAVYSGDTAFITSTSAAQSFTVTAGSVTLTSVSPAAGPLGSAATTVTLTGANFSTGDVVQLNGATISSTYVNATTLTAVIPASFFAKTGTGLITVFDPSSRITTGSLPFTVSNAPTIVFTGPSASTSGSQPSLTFQLVNPYPVALAGTLTLTFAPSTAAGINDPAVQFSTGGRTLPFNIPANSTVTPGVQLQTGTVAGVATVTLTVTANGVNVTPTNVAPVVITIPPAAPTITSSSVTRSGNTLTVTLVGFSNTRETTQAVFHFTAVTGATLNNPDLTLTVTPNFATYYSSAQSNVYGSTFTYTQIFTLDQDASIIQSVTVTLANTIGVSTVTTTQ